jgi:hypothetical protein
MAQLRRIKMEMAESKKVSTKSKVSPKPSRDTPRKNEIPDKILKSFLNREIGLNELDDISKIRAAFLWEVGNVERYRIDVWHKIYKEGSLYPSTKIIHSFFVHYYPEENRVADKTTEKNPEKNRIIKDTP